MSPEHLRLAEDHAETAAWKKFGPYLTERQWGTVREDYSSDGNAWNYITHDMARSYAYRWGEEGIGGVSDARQLLCLGVGLWNGQDEMLKERLFGLTNGEGNHGEDVKEHYYYLDSTPTHSYMLEHHHPRPQLRSTGPGTVRLTHPELGKYQLYCDQGPALLFCDNDTKGVRLYNRPAEGKFYKGGINDYLVEGNQEAINAAQRGTKVAAHYHLTVAAGQAQTVRVRLCKTQHAAPFTDFAQVVAQRRQEADAFYATLQQGMGGNMLSACSDTEFVAEAMRKLRLSIHVTPKLNRGHLTNGEMALPLPCYTRVDIDMQKSGQQFMFCENSMGVVGMRLPLASGGLVFHPRSMVASFNTVSSLLKLLRYPHGSFARTQTHFHD
ncbi:hypothetical protein H8B15_03040 [Hymenobacter sp. BT507]|uniref:Glucosidase n=1 Tax=Hymenobacter citatus TaxID=2763506 RepID=A0ABR7MFQ2_9BACT|nr:hypothetical protein [Hymenobacter citatus]